MQIVSFDFKVLNKDINFLFLQEGVSSWRMFLRNMPIGLVCGKNFFNGKIHYFVEEKYTH